MSRLISKTSLRTIVMSTMLPLSVAPLACAGADTVPSGQVQLGQTMLEPAYDERNGSITYLSTPIKAPEHTNGHAVAPLYVIVYPTSAAGAIGTVNCQHQPYDNCPDHGPAIAGLAESVRPGVYGGGVWGHDHMGSMPPAPPSAGGDFNVAWMPVAVLFTSAAAATQHITTEAQLDDALAAGDVVEIDLPAATFQCSAVSVAAYTRGIPVPPAPPAP